MNIWLRRLRRRLFCASSSSAMACYSILFNQQLSLAGASIPALSSSATARCSIFFNQPMFLGRPSIPVPFPALATSPLRPVLEINNDHPFLLPRPALLRNASLRWSMHGSLGGKASCSLLLVLDYDSINLRIVSSLPSALTNGLVISLSSPIILHFRNVAPPPFNHRRRLSVQHEL